MFVGLYENVAVPLPDVRPFCAKHGLSQAAVLYALTGLFLMRLQGLDALSVGIVAVFVLQLAVFIAYLMLQVDEVEALLLAVCLKPRVEIADLIVVQPAALL